MGDIAEIALTRILERFDQGMTLGLNSLHTPFTDYIWHIFSDRNIWVFMYLSVMVFLFVRLGWKKALLVIAACLLTVAACDQAANHIQDLVERLRPCWNPRMLRDGLHITEGRGNYYGFFSAHAANACGFAICTYMGFRLDHKHKYVIYGSLIFVWAILVAASRIFVGKHFVGDVFVGLCVGALFGWLFARLAKYLSLRFNL